MKKPRDSSPARSADARNTAGTFVVDFGMATSPHPAAAAWSMLSARRVSFPAPEADATDVVDHGPLAPILEAVRAGGVAAITGIAADIETYRDRLSSVEPDRLAPAEALAFWLNLYNAGALWMAARAWLASADSVLGVAGTFTQTWATVAGERLSLDAIEHGKIRRFGDPRIHGALVCGSVSCPTLRYTPFTGKGIDANLDEQMRTFIARGGGQLSTAENVVRLSSVFKWYGKDFVSPHTMPNLIPAPADTVRDVVAFWFPDTDSRLIWERSPRVEWMPYDWALGCSVA